MTAADLPTELVRVLGEGYMTWKAQGRRKPRAEYECLADAILANAEVVATALGFVKYGSGYPQGHYSELWRRDAPSPAPRCDPAFDEMTCATCGSSKIVFESAAEGYWCSACGASD